MRKRLPALFMLIALVGSACSSSDEGLVTVRESGADAGTTDVASGDADGDIAATTTVLSGPTTTFVPPLDGPFSTGGGATSEIDDSVLIVEDSPVLPATLSDLPWDTDWSRRTVTDWDEFLRGLRQLDPRDGIPPIDSPVFETVALAGEWLTPQEPGALVQVNGEARFYPLSIMTRHEIVNDAIGDVPVAVTYCPLCNTALAFDRRVDGEVLRFGVSGLLRNSDLVMWDDSTTSLWQQISGVGVVGRFAGVELETVPTSIVSFEQFAANFPDGRSLAAESGFGRGEYGRNPYVGYSSSEQPFLFAGDVDDRLPALSRVVGITDDGLVASYSFEALQQVQVVNDEVEGRAITVFWAGSTTDALDGGSIASSRSIGSAIAYSPVVDGQLLTFTANSDGTFTDAETNSTWSIVGRAISGELEGSQLDTLTHRNEFWFAWQAFFGSDSLREL